MTTHSYETAADQPRLLSFQESLWHKSAPPDVARAGHWDDDGDGWRLWKAYLASRSQPRGIDRLLPGKSSPLEWSLESDGRGERTAQLIASLWKLTRSQRPRRTADSAWTKEAEIWMAESAGEASSVNLGLERLAWCHALPALAQVLPAALWWELVDALFQAASEVGATDRRGKSPLLIQVAEGELPLSLAYVLGELEPCRALLPPARRTLSEGLVDLLDGEGLPHAGQIEQLRPLLGCWTRAAALADRWKKGCFTAKAWSQYEWLVRQAIRLTRGNATPVFSTNDDATWQANLFQAALHAGGDEDDFEIASRALPKIRRGQKKTAGADDDLPDAAEHSDWSELGILRSSWNRQTDMLSVAYADRATRVELQSAADLLIRGRWEVELQADGKILDTESDWDEVCWFSDEDGVYLELEAELLDGVRIQRQLLLARGDRFVLIADAVLGDRERDWQYRLTLPLVDDVEFRPAEETREGWLVRGGRRNLAMPLALPEWRSDPHFGRLSGGQDGVSLVQKAGGSAFWAPLFIDLDPRRQTQSYTWRQLTVAENLQIVGAEQACGFRIQIGKKQWLIYRALQSKGNRTVLGHNLISEYLVARFARDGSIEPIVEIE